MIHKYKIKNCLQYMFVLFVILASETIWEKMPNKVARDKFSLFVYGMASIIVVLLILSGNKIIKKRSARSIFLYSMYFILLIAINAVIYKVNVALLFSIPTLLMISYFIANSNEIIPVMDKFYQVVFLISLISLIIFVPYIILGVVDAPTTFPFLRNNWTQYAPSFYLFFYPQGTRNCAFFYEAPKFNVILTLALAYSCYIKKEFVTVKNIVILLTIVSAQSVTGILLALFIIATKLIFKEDEYKIGKRNVFLILSPILLTGLTFAFIEIFSAKIASASGVERLQDYYVGFMAWKQNILFGSGIGNNDIIDSVSQIMGRESLGFSNGIFRILAQGGLYLFLLLIIPILKIIKDGVHQKRPYILFFCFIFLAMILTTSFSNTLVYSLYIVFLIVSDKIQCRYLFNMKTITKM